MKFTFSTGYFSIPSELIEKWSWTGLAPSDLLILCAMLKHAHGDKTTANPSFGTLADEIGMSRRGFRMRISYMRKLGILEIMERPGSPSLVDLNPLKDFIKRLKPPVDTLGKKPAGVGSGVPTPSEVEFLPPPGENKAIPGGNRTVTDGGSAPNKGSEKRKPVETTARLGKTAQPQEREGQQEGAPCGGAPRASIDTGIPTGDRDRLADPDALREAAGRVGGEFAPPASAKARRELSDAELEFLARQTHGFRGEVDGYDMATYRTMGLNAGIKHSGTRRQGIEEALRLELRHSRIFGIKARLLHEIFSTYPIDGIVWWMNQAHRFARDRSSYLISMLKRSRGEYPGREAAS